MKDLFNRIRLQLARDICPSTHKVIPTVEIGDLTTLKKLLNDLGYYVSHMPKRKPRNPVPGRGSVTMMVDASVGREERLDLAKGLVENIRENGLP